MTDLLHETARRRTFAIISHPDAGKTTLTEKLLLFGGAIQLAGTVKGRKAARHATSDWMELEKQRGISITSSVMQFPYKDCMINLLDTPGHEDFSEDTYRTLTAVDSALMVIDAAKGVEERTIKLMDVCRLRDTPIMTFVNKLDREGRETIELLDEVESILKIQCSPITWPIGMGKRFKGVYHLIDDSVHLYTPGKGSVRQDVTVIKGIDNPLLNDVLGDQSQSYVTKSSWCVAPVMSSMCRPIWQVNKRRYSSVPLSIISAFKSCWIILRNMRRHRCPARRSRAKSNPPKKNSPASFSRFRRTWIRSTVIASPLCAFVPAAIRGVCVCAMCASVAK